MIYFRAIDLVQTQTAHWLCTWGSHSTSLISSVFLSKVGITVLVLYSQWRLSEIKRQTATYNVLSKCCIPACMEFMYMDPAPIVVTSIPLYSIAGRSEVNEVAQSCPTLCDPVDCSLPGSSVHGIFQATGLEWIAISFSRGSSRPRGRT